jgi:glycosyltransferase involved in cell wall biosynthesis
VSSQRLRIRLIGKDNGVGLSRDLELLDEVLRACGCELTLRVCDRRDRRHRRSKLLALVALVRTLPSVRGRNRAQAPYDVNIMFEHAWPQFLHEARCNVIIPNPEWFDLRDARFLGAFDQVWAKTAATEQVFAARHPGCVQIGFDSRDRYLPEVERTPQFLHVAGKSPLKGTVRLLQLWQRHPEWPRLTLVQDKTPENDANFILAPNIVRMNGYVPDEELRELQNSHRFHLCTSEAEGWGHYIVEAMSTGAVTITCDSAPMNELIDAGRGLLVATQAGERHNLVRLAPFQEAALEQAVQRALAQSAPQLEATGRAARDWFLANKGGFAGRVQRAIDRITHALGAVAIVALLLLGAHPARATEIVQGVSPYLPLNLSPQIERMVERVLVLGEQPILTRPVPISTVLRAMPKACRRDARLCAQVNRYLDRYFGVSGVTHGSLEVAASQKATVTLPNQRGERADAPYSASAAAFYRPGDMLLLTAGGVAYGGTDRRFIPSGTMASLGGSYLQIDAGYRDHWFSPLTDSSALQSTEAPTLPSITVSNPQPLTGLGIQYQLFLARMKYSEHITWRNGYTAGYPRLVGMHLGIEPVDGWAVSGNALWQFGGGARPGSIKDFVSNMLRRTNFNGPVTGGAGFTDRRFSNRSLSITSAYVFPGKTPFAAYVEFAGRDTFHGQTYRFHETALSAGLHVPELLEHLDLTVEVSEWQDAWYTDYVWQDGMTVDGYVTGLWGGDWRTFSNAAGARSAMAQLGWARANGDAINARYRTLQNASYANEPYRRAHMLTLEYAQPRHGYTRGLQLDAGRDAFGDNFARLAAFVRHDGGTNSNAGLYAYASMDEPSGSAQPADNAPGRDARLERFIDLGFSGARLGLDYGWFDNPQQAIPTQYQSVSSVHLGVGVRRAVSAHGDLGVRAEYDHFRGTMLALRIADYRYDIDKHLSIGAFFGFARYSGPTPAQGYYAGGSLAWRNLFRGWDLSFDSRYFDRIQRDKVLPTDPQNGDPVEWYTMQAPSLYLSHRF